MTRSAALTGAAASAVGSIVLICLTIQNLQSLPDNLSSISAASIKPQLLDRTGKPLTITYKNQWNAHDVTPLHRIPTFLQYAFILAEDKRFYQHDGIDWAARLNAVWQNVISFKGLRGASTISEQVVRMIHKRPRTIWSRWLEGWEARMLEKNIDKASILEFYLNQVPYAAQRRGVQQAATYYFDRDLSTLSKKEMLALAVLVRAPSYFDLHKSTTRLDSRLDTLLTRAIEAGLIMNKESIQQETLTVTKAPELLNISHFANYLYGKAKNQSLHQIKTTLSSDYQSVAQKLLNERLTSLSQRQVSNAGMIVVDHQSNEIIVWAVGEPQNNEGYGYDTILVKRQPGSTLKPFVYASAMEKGWTAATLIDDSPLKEGVGQGVHTYRNYSNRYYGKLTLRNALGNSLNIPAIKAAQFVGIEPLMNTLNSLGISGLDLRSLDYGNGLALGNGEVSLYSLVGAYAALARQGVYRPLRSDFSHSNSVDTTVFSPEVSSIVGNILSDPSARELEFGRGGTLSLPVQTAVKTGTSNDYRDAWTVGYNHRYVIGVWMGNLDNKPMIKVTGSSGPALVLRSMFAELNRHTETQPLYLSRKLRQRNLCIGSDLSNTEANHCSTHSEWFRPGKPENQVTKITKATIASEKSYRIAYPIDQMKIARDPRIPDTLETLEFKLSNASHVEKVEWLISDKVVATTKSAKYNWPLKAGLHDVSARVFSGLKSKPTKTQQVAIHVK